MDVPKEGLTQAKESSDGCPVVSQSSWIRIQDGKRLRSPIGEDESPVKGSKHQRLVIKDDEEESLKGLTAETEGSPELERSSGDGNNEVGSLQEVGTPSAVWVPLEGLLMEVEVVPGV